MQIIKEKLEIDEMLEKKINNLLKFNNINSKLETYLIKKRNIAYEELVEIINQLSPNEIIELSNIIGYPVFTRLCIGVLKHKFVLLQDGAAAIIVNQNGQILLQSRADNDRWDCLVDVKN